MPYRKWAHTCTKSQRKELLGVEICPDCGQRGKHDGWYPSVIDMMSAYQHRTDLRALGPHRAMADELLSSRMKTCEECKGRGVIDVDNGEDFRGCPRCHGNQSLFDGSAAEFEALRQRIVMAFPEADPAVPLTLETRQATNITRGFMGGGFFRPSPKDRSLQAYKDWANNLLAAVSPNSENNEPMTEKQWEERWKEHWSKMESSKDKPATEK